MRISRQLLGVTGAVVLALGVFAPIVRLPFVGSVNYYGRGNGEGGLVLVLAAVAAGLALARKYRLILLPAGLSLGMIGYTYVDLQGQLRDIRTAFDGLGPFRRLGDLAVDAVQLQWGWVAMLAGIALLVAAALMPENDEAAEDLGATRETPGGPGAQTAVDAAAGTPAPPTQTNGE